jgi:hypothetical protein
MTSKTLIAAVAMTAAMAASAYAQSQQPAISSAWGDMNLTQARCLDRGQETFQRLKYSRIEAIGQSVFADRGDFQFAFRCVADKQMFYVYGGGPGDSDKQLNGLINDLKAEFSR